MKLFLSLCDDTVFFHATNTIVIYLLVIITITSFLSFWFQCNSSILMKFFSFVKVLTFPCIEIMIWAEKFKIFHV